MLYWRIPNLEMSLISVTTTGKNTVAGYFSFRWLLELGFRQGQDVKMYSRGGTRVCSQGWPPMTGHRHAVGGQILARARRGAAEDHLRIGGDAPRQSVGLDPEGTLGREPVHVPVCRRADIDGARGADGDAVEAPSGGDGGEASIGRG